ncbi:tetraacyldisaccharide 4'-kinase [Acinetobacter sp. HY1485]|uniref:tetraacyldisaccharide 4'-kinase n=1 Tax=Acinetobacter sp. HY1485 TaxID=2970918 RepID=UPI0022B98F41|nr:tetraacyldisaccharide 4'-kinase [Acinetobacter sp. HY1485]
MDLAHIIQNAWNSQAKWLKLLRPLSFLYGVAFNYKKQQYLSGKKPIYTAPIPVMVVGNITIGGSGKTPLLIALVKYLQMHKIKVGVISRGYGGKGPFPTLVAGKTVLQVGDEPALIVQKTQVPMAVGANRQEAIELLLNHYQLDLILSDDGLQHWALARQIEWIVLDTQRGLGNQRLLPEGFLREPISKLKNSTVIEHNPKSTASLNMHLALGQPYLLHQGTDKFNPLEYFHVVVGIGYPERFYKSLNILGLKNLIKHEFEDHHTYTSQDISFNDDLPIITTEKDAVKLKDLHCKHKVWVLPVDAILSDACYTHLQQQLSRFLV